MNMVWCLQLLALFLENGEVPSEVKCQLLLVSLFWLFRIKVEMDVKDSRGNPHRFASQNEAVGANPIYRLILIRHLAFI